VPGKARRQSWQETLEEASSAKASEAARLDESLKAAMLCESLDVVRPGETSKAYVWAKC
jgi:hypothetical protein